jgi:hypothetical protein
MAWPEGSYASPAFTPDGRTVFFTRSAGTSRTIMVSHLRNHAWTKPEIPVRLPAVLNSNSSIYAPAVRSGCCTGRVIHRVFFRPTTCDETGRASRRLLAQWSVECAASFATAHRGRRSFKVKHPPMLWRDAYMSHFRQPSAPCSTNLRTHADWEASSLSNSTSDH